MNITRLELLATDLAAQRDFYADVLDLPVNLMSSSLEVEAGQTKLVFKQAWSDFEGAYHFAFNIPENQFAASKEWTASRIPLLRDESGKDEFHFENWNSHSVYFKDPAGNVLEFIARHNLQNAAEGQFAGRQILQVSEIGLPAENVLRFAHEICTRLGLTPFRQQPDEQFTAVGDEHGLFILPIRGRIWIPNTGVPALPLPVVVEGNASGRDWEVRGVPYEIIV